MKKTRAALARKLDALKERVFGAGGQDNQGAQKAMPTTKTKKGSKKTTARSASRSTGRSGGGKKAKAKKSSTARKGKSRAGAGKKTTRKRSGPSLATQAKRVIGKLAAGAASGAMTGAVQAVAPNLGREEREGEARR
jgi:hypothetical protein